MTNKFMAFCAVAVMSATSLFAGEFSWHEFYKLWISQKNYAGAKEYYNANKDYSNINANGKWIVHVATLCIAGPRCDKQIKTAAEVYAKGIELIEADAVITDKVLAKIKMYAHSTYYVGVSRTAADIETIKAFLNSSEFKTWYAVEENKKNNAYDIATCFNAVKDYESALSAWIAAGNGYQALLIAIGHSNDSAKIIECLNLLADNPLNITDAQQLEKIVGKFGKLTNPKYDESLKACMVALNRAFYPNIGKSDAWKQAVVNLQLKMKAYGIPIN